MPTQHIRVVRFVCAHGLKIARTEGWCMVDPAWAVDGILSFKEGRVAHGDGLPAELLAAANPEYEYIVGRLTVPSKGIDEVAIFLETDGPHPARLPGWKTKKEA